tara:strand:- start:305 stop:751 length:447 start_codon:yes stop_codon:yes gene_type:complete
MLTLNQLLNFEEKTEEGTIHKLSIKKSSHFSCDYEISGIMPVKIDIEKNFDNYGITYDLLDLLCKYAKEKHGSEIYGYSCGIIKDNYKREFRIKLPKYINFDNDPDFVQVNGYYMNFNASYTYHRYTKKYLNNSEKRKKRNKESKHGI